MSPPKKEPGKGRELDPLAGGLSHNPFAALRKDGQVAPAKPALEAEDPMPREDGAGLGRVVLSLERKGHGGKSVVRVEGDLGPQGQRKELARSLGRALGRGARLDGDAIVIQGADLDAPCAWFEAQGAQRVVRGTR